MKGIRKQVLNRNIIFFIEFSIGFPNYFFDPQKNIFCFVQEHIEKNKNSEIKIYFSKLLILNRYVSNLQVPTTSESPWGKVNVSKFMDFGEIWPGTEKTPDFLDFGIIKKNNCYILYI